MHVAFQPPVSLVIYGMSNLRHARVHLEITLRSYVETFSEERRVLGIWSIPVSILSSCQDVKSFASQLHEHEYCRVVKMRNTSEAVLMP